MSDQGYIRFPSGASYFPVTVSVGEQIAFGANVAITYRNQTGTYMRLIAIQGFNSQNDGGGTLDIQNPTGTMLTAVVALPAIGGLAVGTVLGTNNVILNGQDLTITFNNPNVGGAAAMTNAQMTAIFAVFNYAT